VRRGAQDRQIRSYRSRAPGWNEPRSQRVDQGDGHIRADRSVSADLAGSVVFGANERWGDELAFTVGDLREARLGWAAEIFSLARAACLAPSAGLTSWWTGDGTTVDRVGGQTAALRGGAGYGQGIVRSAFRLDGVDDYLRVGNAPAVDVDLGDFTVAAWVRFDSIEGEQVIVEKWLQGGDVPSEGWTLTKLEDGAIRLAVSAADGYEVATDTETGAVEPGRWYLITGRRSGSEMTVLIDGAVRASGSLDASSGWVLSSPTPLLVGRRSDDRGLFLDGSVDEVQLYRGTAVSDFESWLQWAVGPAGLCRS